MNVVKQRKRRLMAWILTITLCVGVWQSSVYATEVLGDNTVSGNSTGNAAENTTEGNTGNVAEDTTENDTGNRTENTTDNDMVTLPTGEEVITMTSGDSGVVELEYIDNLGGSSSDYNLSEGASLKVKTDDETVYLVQVNTDYSSFSIEASTNGYGHKLLSWSMSGESEDINGNENVISAGDNTWKQFTNMIVEWGKIIVISDESENELGVCYQNNNDDGSITLPSAEEMLALGIPIFSDGKFFSGWNQGDATEITLNEYTVIPDFDVMEDTETMFKKVSIGKNYSDTTVPASGTYILPAGEYTLGSSSETWMVGDDGYNYSGGISFKGPEAEYTYTKIN